MDHPGEVLGTRCKHQLQFAVRAHTGVLRIQQQAAYRLTQRGAARFTRNHDIPAHVTELSQDELDVGGLANPFDAFNGDEFTFHCNCAWSFSLMWLLPRWNLSTARLCSFSVLEK